MSAVRTTVTKTERVIDAGMVYEIDFLHNINTPEAIADGAVAEWDGHSVYKVRKDGSRGRQLVIYGARLAALLDKVEA